MTTDKTTEKPLTIQITLEGTLERAVKAHLHDKIQEAVDKAIAEAVSGTLWGSNDLSFRGILKRQIQAGVEEAMKDVDLTPLVRDAVKAHLADNQDSLIANAVNGVAEKMTEMVVSGFASGLVAKMSGGSGGPEKSWEER